MWYNRKSALGTSAYWSTVVVLRRSAWRIVWVACSLWRARCDVTLEGASPETEVTLLWACVYKWCSENKLCHLSTIHGQWTSWSQLWFLCLSCIFLCVLLKLLIHSTQVQLVCGAGLCRWCPNRDLSMEWRGPGKSQVFVCLAGTFSEEWLPSVNRRVSIRYGLGEVLEVVRD